MSSARRGSLLLIFALLCTVAACRSQAQGTDTSVRGHLAGVVTVSAEIDATDNFEGFEIIVGNEGLDGIDTLAFAVTDRSGRFETDVSAPMRGLYPVIIAREGQILHIDQYIIADGDSATFAVELPTSNRPIRFRSHENAAWLAFQNTQALHNSSLVELLQEGAVDEERIERQVNQVSQILWSLEENFPGTVGADLAVAEAIIVLEGWNDSLLVAQAKNIDETNPRYIDIIRAARRSEARLNGQSAALDLLLAYQLRTNDRDLHAAIQSEVVVAHMDSLDARNARLAARNMQQSYPNTPWSDWAGTVLYEIDNLMPGSPAPELSLTTLDGESISLADFRGKFVLLEFYAPASEDYLRQLPVRNAISSAYEDDLEIVSISLQSDPAILEAFFEDRDVPGHHVALEEGADAPVVQSYSIAVLPMRYLIDREGAIVGRYPGEAVYAIQQEMMSLLGDSAGAP